MGFVVGFRHEEPWFVSSRAFDRLAEKALADLTRREDRYAIEQAIGLSGLHLDLIDDAQAVRLMDVLVGASRAARRELDELTATPPGFFGYRASLLSLEGRLRRELERYRGLREESSFRGRA
jgi:hypothetical protein